MCSGPPATLDYKKRSNSRLAESRRRVDGAPATAFVNWANRCSMACSSMHSRAVLLSFEPSVLGAAYHWQKWKAIFAVAFFYFIFNIRLCRGCLIHVSVFLVSGDWCDPVGGT